MRNEASVLKELKKAVRSISNMMMFDSLLNTILAAIVIIGSIIGVIKLVELATGKKITIIPERFTKAYEEDKKYKELNQKN